MSLRALPLVLSVLVGCAGAPPRDGISRHYVDGEWRIVGHNHSDPRWSLERCEGCAAEFSRAVDVRLMQIQEAAQKRRKSVAPAEVAPVSSPTEEAPK